MTAGASNCILVTIPISHYCEKARWALERAGVAYEERAHLQVIHRFAVRRAGGGTTAPVLVCGERVFADSADIVDEADRRAPAERRLFPEDPAAAAGVRELEREFDRWTASVPSSTRITSNRLSIKAYTTGRTCTRACPVSARPTSARWSRRSRRWTRRPRSRP